MLFRGIGVFIEDQLPGIGVGLAFGVGMLLAILVFTDSGFNEADCEAEVLEAEAALVGEMLEAIGPELIGMQLQIQSLQEFLAIERAKNGSSGDPGIRPNEALGAYSDAAGEFYCFPVEGAGFPSG